MAKKKQRNRIATLQDANKYQLRIGAKIGIRCKKGTSVRAAIEQRGDSQRLSLVFSTAGSDINDVTIAFKDAVELDELPNISTSTGALAQALKNRAGPSDGNLGLEEVLGNLFAITIAMRGKLVLERYRGKDGDNVELKITSGAFAATTLVPLSNLGSFIEKAPFPVDSEEWEREVLEKENEETDSAQQPTAKDKK